MEMRRETISNKKKRKRKGGAMKTIIGVRFKKPGKIYFFDRGEEREKEEKNCFSS